MERLRLESNPHIHSSHKEENPIKTRDRCGLPLIPPKAWTGSPHHVNTGLGRLVI